MSEKVKKFLNKIEKEYGNLPAGTFEEPEPLI